MAIGISVISHITHVPQPPARECFENYAREGGGPSISHSSSLSFVQNSNNKVTNPHSFLVSIDWFRSAKKWRKDWRWKKKKKKKELFFHSPSLNLEMKALSISTMLMASPSLPSRTHSPDLPLDSLRNQVSPFSPSSSSPSIDRSIDFLLIYLFVPLLPLILGIPVKLQ